MNTYMLFDSLGRLETILCQIKQDNNEALHLAASPLLNAWHRFNIQYIAFVKSRDKGSVSDLLVSKEIRIRYELLYIEYEQLFKRCLTSFSTIYSYYFDLEYQCFAPVDIYQYNENEVLAMYKESLEEIPQKLYEGFHEYTKHIEERQYEENAEDYKYIDITEYYISHIDINKNIDNSLGRTQDALSDLFRIWDIIASYTKNYLLNYGLNSDSLFRAVDKEFKDYSRAFGSRTLKELKRQAQHYKENRSEKYSPKLWGKVLDAEDDAFQLAIDEKLCKSDNPYRDYFGEDRCRTMEINYRLLNKIRSIHLDGVLFDIKSAIDDNFLTDHLTSDNIELFYFLILRRNILQIEMDDDLKKEYEKWLNSDDEVVSKGEEVFDIKSITEFDAQAVWGYISQITFSTEEEQKRHTVFWKTLLSRRSELNTTRYHKEECCFTQGRNEDKVGFSKVFVCSVIGYLRNKGFYTQTPLELSKMLGEGEETDNARIKNMQNGLNVYDTSVKRVVDDVIEKCLCNHQ